MSDPAIDLLKSYQAMTQQSLESWAQQLAQSQGVGESSQSTGSATAQRTLDGLKGYMDWAQGLMAGNFASGDGQQAATAASHSSAKSDSSDGEKGAGADDVLSQQWQAWVKTMQLGDAAGWGNMPAFGLNREQQQQQQTLAAAMLDAGQASERYQSLIRRAHAQGLTRLQEQLAQHSGSSGQIDSIKTMYDLWVEAAEQAYSEIALSDEFRRAYGDMVNAQMRVRQLQQEQTEQMCSQMGVPTRNEVSALGERLQELRREVAALKRELAARHTEGPLPNPNKAEVAPAVRTSKVSKEDVSKAEKPAKRGSAVKTKRSVVSVTSPVARIAPRKRK